MSKFNWQKKWHDYFVNKEPKVDGLEHLVTAGNVKVEEILHHYRWGNRENLKEVLSDKYEVTLKLIDHSEEILIDYIEKNPSSSFSIDAYGNDFIEYLRSIKIAAHFLELAELENFIYFHGFNKPYDNYEMSWEQLTAETRLSLTNTTLYQSNFDVFTMWNKEEIRAEAGDFYGVIHYRDVLTCATLIEKWEYDLLQVIEKGVSLSELSSESLGEIAPGDVQSFFAFLRREKIVTNK